MRKIFYTIPLIMILTAVFLLLPDSEPVANTDAAQTSEPTAATLEEKTTEDTQEPVTKSIKQFGPNEFKLLFNNLPLPNTTLIIEPPVITGNVQADEHLQVLAEKRGYILRAVPSGELVEYQGVNLQPLLLEDWKALASAAEKAGHSLFIRSAYRSVDSQRQLFIEALGGLSTTAISSGNSDEAINNAMATTAPPGYSRHHNGYTLDLYDPTVSVFELSGSYEWLKANNFENAKKFGFIPSYPEGAINQGPEPESWEFVWVGRDFVLE